MNCYTHNTRSAVGICSVCQKAVCHECVGQDAPRLVCRTCVTHPVPAYGYGYGYGYEYKSSISIGGWPLVHVCSGVDPVTMRPRVAKGIIGGDCQARHRDHAMQAQLLIAIQRRD